MAWISVTTTPARIGELYQTLNAWSLDGVAGILVHVPPVQLRTGAPYPRDHSWLDGCRADVRARVFVHRCDRDWGPLTKWVAVPAALATVGAFGTVGGAADATVVIADDDTLYADGYWVRLAALLTAVEGATGTAAAVAGAAPTADFWGVDFLFPKPRLPPPRGLPLLPGDVCEGFSGIAVRASTLCAPAFTAIATSLAALDLAAWMSDDLVANVTLAELGVARWAVTPRPTLPQRDMPDALSAWHNGRKYTRAAALLSDALHAGGDAAYAPNTDARIQPRAVPW